MLPLLCVFSKYWLQLCNRVLTRFYINLYYLATLGVIHIDEFTYQRREASGES